MQFSRELAEGLYTIHACRDAEVVINSPRAEERTGEEGKLILSESFIITPLQLMREWPPGAIDELEAEHLAAIKGLGLEVLLLGTGRTLRFPAAAQLAALVSLGIGYEVMDTAAACRTYNVLAGEGRRVAAAIIIEN
jgi:uncharacterized protein